MAAPNQYSRSVIRSATASPPHIGRSGCEGLKLLLMTFYADKARQKLDVFDSRL